MKNGQNILIFLVVIGILLAFTFSSNIIPFSISGTATMTRTSPSSVASDSTFNVVYTASGVSGKWGASITDKLTGPCTFVDGTTNFKQVLLSEDGLVKTIQIKTIGVGNCTLSGDFKFGANSIIKFQNKTISVTKPVSESGNVTTTEPETTTGTTENNIGGIDFNSEFGGFPVYYWIIGGVILLVIILLAKKK